MATRKILRLRQLRKERDMTQEALAARVGPVTPAMISALECGKSKPSYAVAMALSRELRVPIEELFDYVDVPA
jgi:putative transcriptional regulator